MKHEASSYVRLALAEYLLCHSAVFESRQRLQADLGLNELDLLLISIRLEERLQIRLPSELLSKVETVGALERLVSFRTTEARQPEPESARAYRQELKSELRYTAEARRRTGS